MGIYSRDVRADVPLQSLRVPNISPRKVVTLGSLCSEFPLRFGRQIPTCPLAVGLRLIPSDVDHRILVVVLSRYDFSPVELPAEQLLVSVFVLGKELEFFDRDRRSPDPILRQCDLVGLIVRLSDIAHRELDLRNNDQRGPGSGVYYDRSPWWKRFVDLNADHPLKRSGRGVNRKRFSIHGI